MLSQKEIEQRKPLWSALSDLWTVSFTFDQTADNQLKKEILSLLHDPAELESAFAALEDYDTHIVREMISSGYSLSEIEVIFAEEVAPVVYSNSHQPHGGEWRHFDPEWLYPAILENLAKQERNPIYRTWVKSGAGKFVMTKAVRDDWKKIVESFQSSNRAANSQRSSFNNI